MMESMVSTIDNPYNPFEDFDSWYAYDEQAGYHTTGFVSRIIATSPELSKPDQDLAYEQAIDEILRENVSGIYIRVSREVSEEPTETKVDVGT